MADNPYYNLIFPKSARSTPFQLNKDEKGIRDITDKIAPLAQRLKLDPPPAEQVATLARLASPMRFERADIMVRFLRERPERGDAKFWQEATEKDLAIGELVELVEPLMDVVEQAAAGALGNVSHLTGLIERTVDRLKHEIKNVGDMSPFLVADTERERMDEEVARVRDRINAHTEGGVAQAQLTAEEDQRAVAAQRLKEADPQRLLQDKKDNRSIKLKKTPD